jgi:hypothetical protein
MLSAGSGTRSYRVREPLIKFGYRLGFPSGAKARVDFAALAAVRAEALTDQSCPDTEPA